MFLPFYSVKLKVGSQIAIDHLGHFTNLVLAKLFLIVGLSMSKKLVFGISLIVAVLAAGPSLADGDAKKGKRVFVKCKACHVLDKEKNKVGPHLVGIIGRSAAAVEGYKYSKGADSMTEFGANGGVWDEATLTEYLRKPKAMIKKTKMAFPGIKKDEQITDLIAYIKSEQ